MKTLKFASFLFFALIFVACGKDKQEIPENELQYPLSFILSHHDLASEAKYYRAIESDVYQEIVVSKTYKSSFENELEYVLDSYFKAFELRKVAIINDSTLEVNYAEIELNTYTIIWDTVFQVPCMIDGNMISSDIFSNMEYAVFYLDEQNEYLSLPQWAYKAHYFSLGVSGSQDNNFTTVADIALGNVVVQDTFGISFFDIIFTKE